MTPGSLILLHTPGASAASWGDLPETLRSYGLDVIAPDIREAESARYVARASLVIAATAPTPPLVLVGHEAAGPLLPAVAAAQRAAHRAVGGYVFLDAELPVPRRAPGQDHGGHSHNGHDHGPADTVSENGQVKAGTSGQVPVPADWPEAPCGYLGTSEAVSGARQARLRGWQVRTLDQAARKAARKSVAQALSELVATL